MNTKTKTVESWERSTGMGRESFTAVLVGDRFVRVSEMEGRESLGRQSGEYGYRIVVPETAIVASFYRSNSGKETVTLADGKTFNTFDLAQKWARERAGKAQERHVCPCCLRPLED